MSTSTKLAGKTFWWRKMEPGQENVLTFIFDDDGSFDYVMRLHGKEPVKAAGAWKAEGKRVVLDWKENGTAKDERGQELRSLYPDLKFTKCESVKSKHQKRKFMEKFG